MEWIAHVAYFVIAFAITRPVFGRARALVIDNYHTSAYSEEPIKRFDQDDKGFVIFAAICASLLWPLSATAWVLGPRIYRYMTGSKIRSHREIEKEKKEMEERIKNLEIELGIREKPEPETRFNPRYRY